MSVVISDPSTREWEEASRHRTRGIEIRRLLQRDGEGRGFEFNLVRFGGEDFFSPRHRHNFDQIRIGLEGTTQYGPREKLGARTIGYFPEGTHYGPLTVHAPSVQAILQFDGASRCGYVNYVHLDRGTEELAKLGTFGGGFYTPNGGKKKDGYQSVWEHVTGREMEYPDRRFHRPVYMHVDGFNWLEDPRSALGHKTLGVFGERHLTIEMIRVPNGASVEVGSPDRTVLVFVLEGGVSCSGRDVPKWGAAMAEETMLQFTGEADVSELIVIGLPVFEGSHIAELSSAS